MHRGSLHQRWRHFVCQTLLQILPALQLLLPTQQLLSVLLPTMANSEDSENNSKYWYKNICVIN